MKFADDKKADDLKVFVIHHQKRNIIFWTRDKEHAKEEFQIQHGYTPSDDNVCTWDECKEAHNV